MIIPSLHITNCLSSAAGASYVYPTISVFKAVLLSSTRPPPLTAALVKPRGHLHLSSIAAPATKPSTAPDTALCDARRGGWLRADGRAEPSRVVLVWNQDDVLNVFYIFPHSGFIPPLPDVGHRCRAQMLCMFMCIYCIYIYIPWESKIIKRMVFKGTERKLPLRQPVKI